MHKIKLHNTSKCLWPLYTDICCEMNVFFRCFHKSLSENVLCKMAIDLLYFRDVYDINLWEKKLAEVRLNNKEPETPIQVFSCGICETFKNSGGCFWAHLTYYYVIKNYVEHKLATLTRSFYAVAFIVNPMIRHESQAWCGMTLRGTSRQ